MQQPFPEVHSILVRGVNWLGDAIMTLPALHRVRERYPAARITMLTQAKLASLWQGHPDISAVLEIEPGQSVFQVAKRLKESKYDLALVLPNSTRSALEPFLARIPTRVGYQRPLGRWLLTAQVARRMASLPMEKRSESEIRQLARTGGARRTYPPEAHHVFEYLHLGASLGANPLPLAPDLHLTTAEIESVGARFGLEKNNVRPWLALNPGAEYGPAKRWPIEDFIAAAAKIWHRVQSAWVILGGPGDVALAGKVMAELTRLGVTSTLNLAGRTSLRELAGVLSQCKVMLTNDTGPMHLAAAVGTPVVVPFGSTSPELTGPNLPGVPSKHQVLSGHVSCAPCFRRECPIDLRCMRVISVDQVVEAAMRCIRPNG